MNVDLYKHNKTAYESVLEHLEHSNRTCVIHPTGSGKSFISLKWLYDNRDKKSLFLCPTKAIKNQLVNHIKNCGGSLDDFPNLTLELYSNVKDDFMNNNYDCIVLDEFHRTGAEVWGRNLNTLLDNNPNAKILGVSATPIRYLDDNRNMAEELFNNDIASEITLAQAIARKILPAPTYINAIYSFNEDIERIEEKVKKYKKSKEKEELEKRLKEAKQMLEKADGLPEIFEKHMSNKKGKYIVFCKNKEHMLQMKEEIQKWVKNINNNITTSEVFYENGDDLNKYTIDYFENNRDNSLKFLFSIEMLNEGLHVNDIDGVVMLRPTDSPIIYMQQLGRALSVGHNNHPLVFDIVNNINTLNNVYELKEEVIKELNNNIEMSDEEKDDILESFKVIDEIKDLTEVLTSLDLDSSFTWDDWYKLAKKYYDYYGNLEVKDTFRTFNGYEEVTPDDPEYENAIALGRWIRNQRNTYKGIGKSKKLTKEQIKLLEDIGIRWENIDRMDNWMSKYELAKAYYEHHGDLEIKGAFKTINGYEEVTPDDPEYENAIALGRWIVNQRASYNGNGHGKITEEQIKLLEDIGMRWENNYDEIKWMTTYKLAKAYYEYHGNLNIKDGFKTINGYEEVMSNDPNYNEAVSLKAWLKNQKDAYKGVGQGKKLTYEQVKLLEDLEINWFTDKTDEKLQNEVIDEKNIIRKNKEITNRLYSLLAKYDSDYMPTSEEINSDFIDQLNRKK